MSELTKILLWSTVFLIPVAGFITAKMLRHAALRNIAYGIVLFCAFIMDLLSVSYVNDALDSMWQLFILFILCDIFWQVMARRSRKVVLAVLVAGSVAYLSYFHEWLLEGPSAGNYRWRPVILAKKAMRLGTYTVKSSIRPPGSHRSVILYKNTDVPGFEKRIDNWVTGPSYYRTPFTCRWTERSTGVKVDIMDGPHALWSLGEEL